MKEYKHIHRGTSQMKFSKFEIGILIFCGIALLYFMIHGILFAT